MTLFGKDRTFFWGDLKLSYLNDFDQCNITMSTISIEFVLADLPSRTNAFTRIKHESKQVSNTLTTYIPCHNTSPPTNQIIKDSADESILHYVEKMKIESKVNSILFSMVPKRSLLWQYSLTAILLSCSQNKWSKHWHHTSASNLIHRLPTGKERRKSHDKIVCGKRP
jgi:hypothetical protein